MFLSVFVGVIMSFVFLLPMVQQGIFLVVIVFGLVTSISVFIGFIGLSWYGFSLFLIYVGGLLVMFGYVISIIPNFYIYSLNLSFVFFFGVFVSLFLSFKVFSIDVLKEVGGLLYSSQGFVVLLGLGFVLFLSLVCVVKICYFRKGSLRPFDV